MDTNFDVKFLWNSERQGFIATPVDEEGRTLKGIPLDAIAERVKQIEQERGISSFIEVVRGAKFE